jgi:hypothetical protein
LASGAPVAASGAAQEDPATDLPDILVTAVRRDYVAYRQTLRRFGPLNPQEEAQAQIYFNAQAAKAQTAFDMVQNAISIDGLDLNDPAQKAVYDQVTNDLMATAYVALSNPSKTVNGPGAADFPASDFIDALRNSSIIIHGGANPANFPGTTTYLAGGRNEINLWSGSISSELGYLGTTIAVATALFHEMGHALGASRLDAETSLANYTAGVAPGSLTSQEIVNAWMATDDRRLVEQRTTARGWGLAEIAGRPFDPNAIQGGSAPR